MARRAAGLLTLVLCGGLASPGLAAAEPVRITIDGGNLTYGLGEGGWARLSGGVQIHVTSPNLIGGEVLLHCDEIDVDLLRGCLRAPGEVKLQGGPALLVGQGLTMNARTQEFAMGPMSACLGQGNPALLPGEPWPIIYTSGKQIVRRGDAIIVMRGRVTTCDRDHPHWSAGAGRIVYNAATGLLRLSNVDLHLFGVRIPVLPWAKMDLGPDPQRWGVNWSTTPGYDSREGAYLPYSWRLTDLENPWDAGVYFHITTRQGLTGSAKVARSWGATDFDLRASRKEWMPDNITDQLELYRLPELSVRRYLCQRTSCQRELRLDASAGRYRETLVGIGEDSDDADRLGKQIRHDRVDVAATYTVGAPDLRRHEGAWYGLSGRWANYSTHDSYGDLELFAGGGRQFSRAFSAYGTLRHHALTGSTPFLFDNVDIRSELAAGTDWQIDPLWRLRGTARFDLSEGEVRDYELRLNRRVHCLTLGLSYRYIGDQIGFSVDLTGFTGGTRPYPAESSMQRRLKAEGLQLQPPASSWTDLGARTSGPSGPREPPDAGPLCPPATTRPATEPGAAPQPGVTDAEQSNQAAPQGAGTETK